MKKGLFLLMSFVSLAIHAEVVVIANENVSLKMEEIKDVFTGEKQAVGSVKLMLVDNKAAQDEFLKNIGVDKVKYNAIWAKKSFQDGLTTPKMKGTDSDVVEFVKTTPGGVGYVTKPGSAKVIGKF